MRRILFVILLSSAVLSAQDPVTNAAEQDPATEIGKLKKNCFAHLLGCAEVFFTGDPVHIAVGTIAPQNGVAGGLAFVGHRNLESGNWRISMNADAVASGNRSWRAGMYVQFVDTALTPAKPQFGTANVRPADYPDYVEQPVINVYAQSISLNKLTFFGLGPTTLPAGRSYYGMTEHIGGVSGVRPFGSRLNFGVYGESNIRVVDLRPDRGESSPSIEQLYSSATAPGLGPPRTFIQLAAGARIRPSFFNNALHFDDDVAYRPYFSASGSGFSFQRLTINAYQEYSLHHSSARVTRESNGPDDCTIDPATANHQCPKPGLRSAEGVIGLRFLTTISMTPGNNVVPFYFQPTLGGADINGEASLPSYQDYRFRAPDLLLIRENFEHSVGRLPLGVAFMADQAKLGIRRGDLGNSPWIHSYAAGLTLRAGGFPQVYLLFAFGGKEGTHTIVNLNTSLLGSSSRPSLY